MNNTVKQLSEICDKKHADIYMWLAFDPIQRDAARSNYLKEQLQDHFNGLAVCRLQEVLRNSQPIIEVINAQYTERSSIYSVKQAVPIGKDGHTINGPMVDCYMLTGPLDHLIHERYLKEMLNEIMSHWPQVPTAVLYFAREEDAAEKNSAILHKPGKNIIDIKTFYRQRNKLLPSQIICDSREHLASFEIPLVIFVSRGLYSNNYIMCSRARSKLVYIQLYANSNHIDEGKKWYPNARFIISDSSDYKH